ncbi:alpha/beta fold hydrolase [Novosphingobium guangzhouense]|uniref:Alpha/beta hydrolase n=1 Tax=Novosphingobium guangzhouense TaxID=1850347 RepID=A0A2K2G742_9SPHN|nr:alpha/beta hydrolase [Novosphingobium guangzhouense]PNU06840.1 alpha/beta hydrolase [Novosphingobium guangzhouense]
MRWAVGAAMLAIASIAGAGAGAEAPPQLSDAHLRERYALPASHFETIAGEPLHYVDEGRGPAILLLHGSYANLRQWDGWAAKLKRHYRVIRFDQSPLGLSGPNPRNDYELDQRIAVIDGLMDKLGVRRFVIVGTSSAGVQTAAYAAARPERVSGAILSNIAAGPLKIDYAAMPQALKDAVAQDAKHPGWHEPEFWRQIMLANMLDAKAVTPELVAQWTDLNNRAMRDPATTAGAMKAATGSLAFSRTPQDLRAITVPTLLLWSSNDHEVPVEKDGHQALEMLGATDKKLEIVAQCGHMMPMDCPARSVEAAMPFLKRVAGK